LQEALLDKQQKLQVPRQCLARRSRRPANERVLDEAEIELTAEVREFEQAIAQLQEELKVVEGNLRSLRAAKFKMYVIIM